MTEKIDPIRKTDDEAFELAQKLLKETKYASLAVNDTGSDYPLVSRVAACFSVDTGLFFAGSDLSQHSKCIAKDNKCSLMLGEPGKGDGLAYARITLVGEAARMSNDHEQRGEFRQAFVGVHPKAELYIDFLDFGFYPLKIHHAYLNGGFGKAYHLDEKDLSPMEKNLKTEKQGPLSGYQIIDLTSVVLGPYCTQLLGDLGADVIKIETPGGDIMRHADLRKEGAKKILRKLIKSADGVIHNIRAGGMRRLGFDYESVKEINPEIVYCHAVGFGSEGHYAERQAYDDLVQAVSGASFMIPMQDGTTEPRYFPGLSGGQDNRTSCGLCDAGSILT
ncbi:Acetyl-CoA:oxalate CoA-transferase [Nymphon striatum]|nr:Acetyl-CoA:oxalate CoA-transferase [Nymphon striatum]